MLLAASNYIWPENEIIFERRNSTAEVSECNDTDSSLISIQGMDENMKSITLEGLDVGKSMTHKLIHRQMIFFFLIFSRKFLFY